MVQRIPLSGGLAFALADDEDTALLAGYSWYLQTGEGGRQYARGYLVGSGNKNRVMVLMHVLVTGKKFMDHENGDGLDNQKHNLREATGSQNGANGAKQRRKITAISRYKGVTQSKGRWRAQIKKDYRVRHLGSFPDEITAARAYDEAAVRVHGKFARTNVMLGLLPPPSPSARPVSSDHGQM